MFLRPPQVHFSHVQFGRKLFNYSHNAFYFVKWTLIESWPWERLRRSLRNWNKWGPLLYWNRSRGSLQMAAEESDSIILPKISLQTEFRSHEVTMLLFRIQCGRRARSTPLGLEIEPSTYPNLFLEDNAITIPIQLLWNKNHVRLSEFNGSSVTDLSIDAKEVIKSRFLMNNQSTVT